MAFGEEIKAAPKPSSAYEATMLVIMLPIMALCMPTDPRLSLGRPDKPVNSSS